MELWSRNELYKRKNDIEIDKFIKNGKPVLEFVWVFKF